MFSSVSWAVLPMFKFYVIRNKKSGGARAFRIDLSVFWLAQLVCSVYPPYTLYTVGWPLSSHRSSLGTVT